MGPRRSQTAVQPLRVYVDTSVFGGVHDNEFRTPSERFFAAMRGGAFIVLVSEPLVVEIASAPSIVRATFEAHRATWSCSRPRRRPRRSRSLTSPLGSSPRPRASMRSMSHWPRSREPTRS